MKKRPSKFLIGIIILLGIGVIVASGFITTKNLKLEKEIVQLQNEKDRLLNNQGSCENTINSYKTEIDTLQKETQSLKEELSEKAVTITSLQKQINKLKSNNYTGGKLTKAKGVNQGPSGKETWYNLPMSGVVSIMRNKGYSESQYPYWIRNDGVKMFGNYVMIAANLAVHPRGSIVRTSLGDGIVCDTGEFAKDNPTQIDIAVNW